MYDEKIGIYKKRVLGLEEKVKQIDKHKIILINLVTELNKGSNVQLNNILHDIDLQENISYLDDWLEFYSKYIKKYKLRLKTSKQIIDKPIEKNIKEMVINALKLKKPLARYLVPLIILLLLIAGLFLFEPAITGHVILSKEMTYNESLNLNINESGTYEWKVKNPGNIKSIIATGRFSGNGTVKVYIEKDGKKYLIYKN